MQSACAMRKPTVDTKRYFYGGLLVIVAVVGIVLFFYRTLPAAVPAEVTGEFGGVSLRIEAAITSTAQERGLGGRTSIPSDYGMLFVFAKDAKYGFWMKDMLVPIDIFWLDDKGQVVSIAQEVAPSSYPDVFYPSTPARYVLETSAGFATAHGIATGTALLLKKFPTVSK